eukprot:Em0002g986a
MGKNYVFVFTGRWRYLRVQFPYLFANLRVNGGVIDYIHYVMINYDPFTQGKLESLASMVRNLTENDETLVINYLSYPRGHPPSNPKKGAYATAYMYHDNINGIIRHPCNRYFKVDDDVVYIHPGTFENTDLEKPVLFALQILLVQTGDAASFIKIREFITTVKYKSKWSSF